MTYFGWCLLGLAAATLAGVAACVNDRIEGLAAEVRDLLADNARLTAEMRRLERDNERLRGRAVGR